MVASGLHPYPILPLSLPLPLHSIITTTKPPSLTFSRPSRARDFPNREVYTAAVSGRHFCVGAEDGKGNNSQLICSVQASIDDGERSAPRTTSLSGTRETWRVGRIAHVVCDPVMSTSSSVSARKRLRKTGSGRDQGSFCGRELRGLGEGLGRMQILPATVSPVGAAKTCNRSVAVVTVVTSSSLYL